MADQTLKFSHVMTLVVLIALLLWGAHFASSPSQPLMPGVKVVAAPEIKAPVTTSAVAPTPAPTDASGAASTTTAPADPSVAAPAAAPATTPPSGQSSYWK